MIDFAILSRTNRSVASPGLRAITLAEPRRYHRAPVAGRIGAQHPESVQRASRRTRRPALERTVGDPAIRENHEKLHQTAMTYANPNDDLRIMPGNAGAVALVVRENRARRRCGMKLTAMVKVEFEGDQSMDQMALETALQRGLRKLCLGIEYGLTSGDPFPSGKVHAGLSCSRESSATCSCYADCYGASDGKIDNTRRNCRTRPHDHNELGRARASTPWMGMGYWGRHCDSADIGRALSPPLLWCTLLWISLSLLSSSLLLRWFPLRVWIPSASLLSLSLLSSVSFLSPLSSIRLFSSSLVRSGHPTPQLRLTSWLTAPGWAFCATRLARRDFAVLAFLPQ